VKLLEAGRAKDASDYIRDVHWDYDVQRTYVEQYYGLSTDRQPVVLG
jgi:hypothetical protein